MTTDAAFTLEDEIGHAPVQMDRPGGTAGIGLDVGPGVRPHSGADLSTGTVDCGTLICPWHGLRSAGDWEFGWRTLPAHDDGVLAWLRLDTVRRRRTAGPSGCSGPAHRQRLHAVSRLVGVCEPDGIIANRLDSWHGAGFHPYSFTHLDVLTAPPVDDGLAEDADRFLVAVTFQIGRLRIPVVAEFTSPEPRTIVVRIVDGRRNRQRRRNPRHPGGSRRRQKATHRGIGSGHRSLGPDRLRPSAQGGCAPTCSCGCCPATSAGT